MLCKPVAGDTETLVGPYGATATVNRVTATPERPRTSPSRRLGTGWPDSPRPFEADTERILIAGDWHGTLAFAQQVVAIAGEFGASTVIVAGDHGFLWPGDKTGARKINKACQAAGVRLVLVPGNHDNWDALDAIPVQPDGFARVEEWVWHVPRPHRWEVAGVRFAALGGAHSIDRDRRRPGRSWWAQELVRQEDVDALGDERVDVLITHEAPAGFDLNGVMHIAPKDAAISERQRELVRDAVERTAPDLVFHGHWHQRSTHVLTRGDGGTTAVLSLAQEWTVGNWVFLDLPHLHITDPRVVAPVPLG